MINKLRVFRELYFQGFKKFGFCFSEKNLVRKYRSLLPLDGIAIDLGCGKVTHNPFNSSVLYGIDIRENISKNIIKADLSTQAIPFEDNSITFCTAYDFIEHIPRVHLKENGSSRFPFIELMNEIHRVLIPGGVFMHRTPAYPSRQALWDPTHVNLITESTFPYFFCNHKKEWSSQPSEKGWAHMYGFNGSFELVTQKWLHNTWVIGLMTANK